MKTFRRLESEVRGYCRSFPTIFTTARGAILEDEKGERYIDLLAGAGTLNYGHNPPEIKKKVIEYLEQDGLLHGLDMHTAAKKEFLETFEKTILFPNEMDYKVQFTGPTGTNAVEASFKLARKITGRTNIVAFTNGFHGMTLGSAAATGNSTYRDSAGVPLSNVAFMPYDGYLGDDMDTLEYFRKFLEDSSSGLDLPAAAVVETIQGEGGVNVASYEWLRGLAATCQEYEILLIVDDIQVGCGRTGTFFSFEEAGISPDIVTLSKSLSGYGLPMSLVLMKSELDQWEPGEHTGTFRGNNLAFVSAAESLKLYWRDGRLTQEVKAKGRIVKDRLDRIAARYPDLELDARGRGLMWGLGCPKCPDLADAIQAAAFKRKLIIETGGTDDNVLKVMPPLTIERNLLEEALDIVEACYEEVLHDEAFLKEHHLEEARR